MDRFGYEDYTNDYVFYKFRTRGKRLIPVGPDSYASDIRGLLVAVDSPILRRLTKNQLISWRGGGATFYSSYDRRISQKLGGWKSSNANTKMLDEIYAQFSNDEIYQQTTAVARKATDNYTVSYWGHVLHEACSDKGIKRYHASIAKAVLRAVYRSGLSLGGPACETFLRLDWLTIKRCLDLQMKDISSGDRLQINTFTDTRLLVQQRHKELTEVSKLL